MLLRHRNSLIVAEKVAAFSFDGGWLRVTMPWGLTVEWFSPTDGQAIFEQLQQLHGQVVNPAMLDPYKPIPKPELPAEPVVVADNDEQLEAVIATMPPVEAITVRHGDTPVGTLLTK